MLRVCYLQFLLEVWICTGPRWCDRVGLGDNRTERGSAGSISFPRSFGEIDPALPRSVLFESAS
jgi:hypothetical protein